MHAKQYAQEDVKLREPVHNTRWSMKLEEYRPLLYIETHFFRNLLVTSFWKLPETLRTFRAILDHSGFFQILLDRSPAQRSSPDGLTSTCAGGDSPCAAVLAQRLIGTCTSSPQTTASSHYKTPPRCATTFKSECEHKDAFTSQPLGFVKECERPFRIHIFIGDNVGC